MVSQTEHKAKVALQGPSGAGKTYGALLMAFGLTGSFEKVAVIDTDNASSIYSYFGRFNTLSLGAPFTAEKFIDAIELCESSGIEAIIVDSLSQIWKQQGSSCTIQYEQFLSDNYILLNTIKRSNCHIICTVRSEENYRIITTHYGAVQVQKLGLSPIQVSDIHYYFNTVLALDMNHKTQVLKDRTSFFEEHANVILSEELAALYARWLGRKPSTITDTLQYRIDTCASTKELLELLLETDDMAPSVMSAFIKRKHELQAIEANPVLSRQNKDDGTNSLRATA